MDNNIIFIALLFTTLATKTYCGIAAKVYFCQHYDDRTWEKQWKSKQGIVCIS